MPTVHVLHMGEGPGGTSGAHTFTCETWYSLLQVTSPAQEDLPALTHIAPEYRTGIPVLVHWVGVTASSSQRLCFACFTNCVHGGGRGVALTLHLHLL